MSHIFEMLGGKKIGVCMIVFAVASVGLFLTRLTSAEWIGVSQFLVVAALGSNVAGMGIHGFAKNKISGKAKNAIEAVKP